MACLPCSDCSSTSSVNYTLPDCPSGELCDDIQAADCVIYKGPNLPSLSVSHGDRIKDILIKIYKSINTTVVTKTYTILVNSSQSSTKVEYLDANEALASSIVAAGATTTICAIENTPQVMYGTGFLIKGPIVYTSSAGATSNSTTVTVASTTGLVAGQTIFVYSGTGVFPSNTTVSSVTNSTTFVASQAPTIALTGSSTIIKAYTTGSVTCP
jgi:hypothetical protein